MGGWVKWILLGTGTASVSVSFSTKHPEIYYMILETMRRVSQPKVLLVVLIWVTALPCAGGMNKNGLNWEFQKTKVDLER